MLVGLRKYTRGIFGLLFVFLLAIAFVIYEIRDIFSPIVGNDLAKGEGVEITPRAFDFEFKAVLRDEQQRANNPALSQRDLVDAGVDGQVLQGMIARESRAALAERYGFAVSDAMVRNQIMTGFKNPVTGAFDRREYEQRLATQGMTPVMYEGFLRKELTRIQMERASLAGVRAPSSYGRLIYMLVSERRGFTAALLKQSALPPIPDPTDQELTAWYASPPQQFIRPEQRVLTLVIADPAAFLTRVTLKDEDVARQLEFDLSRATTPETRSFVQIGFGQDRAKADQALQKLKAGATPEAVAAELGGQAIPFQNATKNAAPDSAVAAAVFSATAPGDLGVIQSPLGFSVARLSTITPIKTPNRAEIEARVRQDLTTRAAAQLAQDAIDAFETARGNGDDLAPAAAAAGLILVTTPPVDARGLDDAGKPVEVLRGLDSKLEEAFKTPEGEITQFAAAPDGRSVSAQVDRVTKSAVRPLTETRQAAIAVYKAQKLGEALTAAADAVKADVAAGKPFAEVARARGLTLQPASPEFTRESLQNTPFARMGGALFGQPQGSVVAAPVSDGVLLMYIDRVIRVDPTLSPGIIEQRREQAEGLLQQSLQEAITSAALEAANVRINKPRLDALVGRVQDADQRK